MQLNANIRANILLKQTGKNFEMDRIDRLKEFLEKDPNDSFLKHALALEYIKAGDDTSARQLFTEVLEKEPSYTGSYYHLAKLLERSGETDSAIATYERGITECNKVNDRHALSELQAALDDLIY